jgi:hypothetical protein
MIIFFIIGHPLVAFGVLLFMIVILATERLARGEPRTISSSMIMFSMVILLSWIVFNSILVRDLRNIVEQLIGLSDGMSTLGNASGMASQVGILSTMQSILTCTVDDLIYILLSLWMGLLILRSRWRIHPMTPIMACFLAGGIFLGALVLFTFAHNPFRLINLNFVMIITVPLVGYLLHVHRAQIGKFKSRLITSLIIFCLISTLFTLYQGPLEVFPNASVTRSEIAGSNWYFNDREVGKPTHTMQTQPWRYADLIHGTAFRQTNIDMLSNGVDTTPHFDSFLNSSVATNSYLVLSLLEEAAYTSTWAATEKFYPADFYNLTVSSSVNTIYNNSGLTIYARSAP